MKQRLFILFLTTIFFVQVQRNRFASLLNVRTNITATSNVETSYFSYLGAWHAYALPERKEGFGLFIGPLLMGMDGKWR